MIKSLANVTGISGLEDNVRTFIKNELREFEPDISVDKMGNLFVKCIKNNEYPTIILSAHMDEVGFIITDITDDGYLKFDTIGGIKPCNLISKKVKVGDNIGIIALKAIHLTTKDEREKPVKISDLFIDIGAKSKAEAEEVAEIGDYCSFEGEITDFGSNYLKGKAFNSRVGCAALIDILKNNSCLNINLICVFTVQSNVQGRGAVVAANSIDNADYLIVTDGFPANSDKNPISGRGAVLSLLLDDTDKSKKLCDTILDISKNDKIPIQYGFFSGKSDLDIYKARRSDIPSVAIGVPVKYINTPTEVVKNSDIKACCDIILGFLAEVSDGKNL